LAFKALSSEYGLYRFESIMGSKCLEFVLICDILEFEEKFGVLFLIIAFTVCVLVLF
jgi:hypothetical protein